MPTAAKLVAAAWFALMGFLAANAHIPALGDGSLPGMNMFRAVAAVIGLACGWMVMGNGIGGSYADSIGNGLKTSVITAFFCLLVFSGRQMMTDAFKSRYDGPMEAMMGWAMKMMENGREMLSVGVIGVLIIGGLVGGPLTEWAWRRWR